MAKGKNKKLPRKDKQKQRGDRHPFSRKEWFNVISPGAVQSRQPVGWTCCKKPQGTQVVSDFLKGRIAELTYADITNSATDVSKRVYGIVDEVSGSNCFTNFYRYELASDKISGLIRKRQTLIEVNTEVKSIDGITLRVFVVIVSNRQENQKKLNSYVKMARVKLLRKKLVADLQAIAAKQKSDSLVYDVLTGTLQKALEKTVLKIVPGAKLEVSKVKTVKRGAVDTKKLVEEYQAAVPVENAKNESPDAQNTLSKE